MPVENKIHQGHRTIPHVVWPSFTFQLTGCVPGEFIIDQRQWSCFPRSPLLPPSFPIFSFFPAVTIFSIPSCQLPAQGYVKGVCKSYKLWEKHVVWPLGWGWRRRGHSMQEAWALSCPHMWLTAPCRLCYRQQQGTWGRQKHSLSRAMRKKNPMDSKQRWGLNNTIISEWTFSTQHAMFP